MEAGFYERYRDAPKPVTPLYKLCPLNPPTQHARESISPCPPPSWSKSATQSHRYPKAKTSMKMPGWCTYPMPPSVMGSPRHSPRPQHVVQHKLGRPPPTRPALHRPPRLPHGHRIQHQRFLCVVSPHTHDVPLTTDQPLRTPALISDNTKSIKFTYAKYPTSFKTCLQQMVGDGYTAFETASHQMTRIHNVSAQLPDAIRRAVTVIVQSTSPAEVEYLLPNALDSVSELTNICVYVVCMRVVAGMPWFLMP